MLIAPALEPRLATTSGPPTILIVDRQALFVAAVASLLSASPLGARVIAMANSDRALEAAAQGAADVVLCELAAEPTSGAEVVRALAGNPSVRVILLSEPGEEHTLIDLLNSGAAGLFSKATSPEEFIAGVGAVLAGHVAVCHNVFKQTMVRLTPLPAIATRLDELSPSERQILVMIGQAVSVPDMAEARGSSAKTIRNHMASIYRKLNVTNRTQAMLYAARLGLVDAGQHA